MFAWIKANPYKAVGILLAQLAVLATAFAFGRYTLPEKIVEKLVTQEVVKEVIKTEIQVVEKKVYVKAQQSDVQTKIVYVEKPDGTKETTTVIVDKTKTDEASSQATVSTEVKVVEKEKLVYVEKLKLVENAKAQWHLGLRLGAGALIDPTAVSSPLMSFGLQAERRIVGPVWMGVWADTHLLMLNPKAPPYTVVGGISVGLEF